MTHKKDGRKCQFFDETFCNNPSYCLRQYFSECNNDINECEIHNNKLGYGKQCENLSYCKKHCIMFAQEENKKRQLEHELNGHKGITIDLLYY